MDVRLIMDSNSVKRKGGMRTIVHEQVLSNTVLNIFSIFVLSVCRNANRSNGTVKGYFRLSIYYKYFWIEVFFFPPSAFFWSVDFQLINRIRSLGPKRVNLKSISSPSYPANHLCYKIIPADKSRIDDKRLKRQQPTKICEHFHCVSILIGALKRPWT